MARKPVRLKTVGLNPVQAGMVDELMKTFGFSTFSSFFHASLLEMWNKRPQVTK